MRPASHQIESPSRPGTNVITLRARRNPLLNGEEKVMREDREARTLSEVKNDDIHVWKTGLSAYLHWRYEMAKRMN
jgi:hypothetical protein